MLRDLWCFVTTLLPPQVLRKMLCSSSNLSFAGTIFHICFYPEEFINTRSLLLQWGVWNKTNKIKLRPAVISLIDGTSSRGWMFFIHFYLALSTVIMDLQTWESRPIYGCPQYIYLARLLEYWFCAEHVAITHCVHSFLINCALC